MGTCVHDSDLPGPGVLPRDAVLPALGFSVSQAARDLSAVTAMILPRCFEAHGTNRRTVSIIKERAGAHESTFREYCISEDAISLGDPPWDFHDGPRGIPSFHGGERALPAPGASDGGHS
jgi:hypothetical protein